MLEAFDGYWRKTPAVKRLVMKVIPDESTRLAALKGGEVDIAYSIRGDLAKELQATPGLTLKSVVLQATNWIYFPEQWDPKSPWNKLQVRQAANLALDRKGMERGAVPRRLQDQQQHHPGNVRLLLAAAAGGLRSGEGAESCWPKPDIRTVSTPGRSGATAPIPISARSRSIRCSRSASARKLQPIERAAFASAYADKKLDKGILRGASGAFGNAATRLASFVVKGGSNVYGSYPDIDELFPKQAAELDPKKREAILHKMQQLVHEKAIYAPIWELAFINGVGPRLGESSFGRIGGFPYTAPFEDLTIQKG